MRFPFVVLIFLLVSSSNYSLLAQAVPAAGCTLKKGDYQCDRAAFLAALRDSRAIAVESKPFDQATTNSLGKLVRTLNKQEVSDSADLTFVLIRTEAAGIFFGPSGRELASFLVYSRGAGGREGKLIWIETFDGEPDMAWPIVVFDILKQFKATIQ